MIHALYYPYFRVRDERWLKVAALYWPKIVRMIPEDFHGADTDAVRALTDELGIVERHPPGPSVDNVTSLFMDLLAEHGAALNAEYGLRIDHTELAWSERASSIVRNNPRREDCELAILHKGQVHPALISAFVDCGLALDWARTFRALVDFLLRSGEVSGDVGEDVYELLLGSHRQGTRVVDERDWLVMDATLVSAYSSVLAEDFANANQLRLTTDRPDMYAMTNRLTSEGLAAALLEYSGPLAGSPMEPDLAEVLAFMTLQLVVPADIHLVPISKIIEVRRRYGDEFLAFGQAIEEAGVALAELSSVRDAAVLEGYLRDEVESRFVRPAEQLRKQLRSLSLDAAAATINVKTELPAALGLVGGAQLSGHPLVAGTLAAALGVLSVGRNARRQRATAMQVAPVPSYLLHIQAQLNPRDIQAKTVARAFRALGGDSK